MTDNIYFSKTVEQAIKTRRTTRSFTNEAPTKEDINQIVASAIYAPYGGATGIPLHEMRRVFIFTPNSDKKKEAKKLLISQIKKNSKKINNILTIFPFLKKKMKPFSERLKSISRNGIPSLDVDTYFIIVAEKKGFPPIEKQSLAHALQNMWLTATDKDLGFHLLSATGTMANNKQFLNLLGLPKGEYMIDGCVIGTPKSKSETIKAFDLNRFVKWIE